MVLHELWRIRVIFINICASSFGSYVVMIYHYIKYRPCITITNGYVPKENLITYAILLWGLFIISYAFYASYAF